MYRWFRNRTEIAKKTLSVVVGAHWIDEDEESQRRFQVRTTVARVYGISALRNTPNCTLLATARTAGAQRVYYAADYYYYYFSAPQY